MIEKEFYTFCPECQSSFIYDIGYNVWECHDCQNTWSQKSNTNGIVSEERKKQFFEDWIVLREESKDESGDKLCYCGHTYKCSCADPDIILFDESVQRGALNPIDPDNGWKNEEI